MKKIFLAAFLALGMTSAMSAPILTDLTEDDYIVIGNLKWAAASPVTSQYFFGMNELFKADLHAGWREASDAEWMSRPDWSAFSGKCAAKYWNSSFTHCDFGDALSQHWVPGDGNAADLWYVSEVAGEVPEPTSLALLGLGMLGAAVSRRRKN